MTSLENKVLQCASGEKRLNPDELRQYFGTYAERVVLAVLLENAEKKTVIDHFPQILKDLQAVYPNLSLKLSPKLADQIQFTYIKTAQALNISATIVDEAKAHSPYGLILHSNQAENLDKVLFSELYPDILAPKETEPVTEKRDFSLNYLKIKLTLRQLFLISQLSQCFIELDEISNIESCSIEILLSSS